MPLKGVVGVAPCVSVISPLRRCIMVGSKFGHWLVEGPAPNKHGKKRWVCKCECGTIKAVQETHLIHSQSTNCGCVRRSNMTKHGGSYSKTYSSWKGLRSRCQKSNRNARYNQKGIKVCDRWIKFENFLADMGERPFDGAQVDRINNNGDYTPENCRWASKDENNINKDNTRYVWYMGHQLTLRQLAEKTGLRLATLRNRHSRGWSDEKIVSPYKNSPVRAEVLRERRPCE